MNRPLNLFMLASLLALSSAQGEPTAAEKNLAEYARGVFAELAGDTKTARKHFDATLENDPASFQTARKAADVQLMDDDLPSAAGTLRTFARAQPDHLASHLYYADFLEQYSERDAAARRAATEVLQAADRRFPHNYAVFSRLINLHENLGEREKSLAIFDAQFEAAGAGPEHWMALGPIAKTLLPGDSPELKERLDTIAERTVETGVGIPMAARAASDYYRKTGRLQEAIAVLQKHLEIQPDSLALRTRLGLLQLYDKQEEVGVRTLHETLQIDPDQVVAHRALSQYYARNEQPVKALFHSAEVLRVSGGAPEDFLELADQYLELAKPHEARLLLERARFDHPENPALAARLAIATLRDGDTTAASRLFRQAEALAKDSGDPAAQKYLDSDFKLEFARSLRQAGDPKAAETRLRSAIRGIPAEEPAKLAGALRELARLWIEQKRDLVPATQLLKRAEGLDPGNEETQELLKRAKGE